MRLLFYPALGDREVDELMPGIGAHTDFECFTILRQDSVPALQVANHKGEWIDAQCIPNTFVINIGDQLMRWTSAYAKARLLLTPRRHLCVDPTPRTPHCRCGSVLDPLLLRLRSRRRHGPDPDVRLGRPA